MAAALKTVSVPLPAALGDGIAGNHMVGVVAGTTGQRGAQATRQDIGTGSASHVFDAGD